MKRRITVGAAIVLAAFALGAVVWLQILADREEEARPVHSTSAVATPSASTRLPADRAELWACEDFRELYDPAVPMDKGALMFIVETADDSPALVDAVTDLVFAWYAPGESGFLTWRQAGDAFIAACARVGQ